MTQNSANLTSIAVQLSRAGKITEEDVKTLRGITYDDGHISASEADTVFGLANKVEDTCDAWDAYFVEVMTDFLVMQAEPRGYVSPENADWLMSKILKDGEICQRVELDLLVKIIERATMCPERLTTLALNAVRDAVLNGQGVLSGDSEAASMVVTDADVELLRRILYAAGGSGHIAITRAEAEILFELNDNTDHETNAPAWNDLFVKAIANNLMAHHGFKPPARDVAIRREQWLDDDETEGFVGFLGAAISLRGIWSAYTGQSHEERSLAYLEEQRRNILMDESGAEEEGNWVLDRIGRDGVIQDNERALLQFLKDESPDIFEGIDEVLTRAA